MKYYLIAGEASGDLHASHLMAALKRHDAEAEFRFFGGDAMAAEGGTMVKHYRELAYMGFIPVVMHLRTILRNMRFCEEDILQWKPDAVVLVDYPGFNLKIAKFLKGKGPKVYYYIAPKIWAWKEHRIKNIKRDIDELFSILPFEIDFFEKKHHYPSWSREQGDARMTFLPSLKEKVGVNRSSLFSAAADSRKSRTTCQRCWKRRDI